AGEGDEGSVMCFVRGDEMKPSASEAFTTLMQTGELGALGKVRYAYAKKNAKTGKTLLLTAWTESKFNLYQMLANGKTDAIGEDFPEIPRVPNSVRAIAARAEGTPYAINVYKTTDRPEATLAFYDGAMKERGWLGYDPEMNEAEEGAMGRAFLK